jgi:Adenylate and Guanylate cyclase catalytic domain
VNYEVLAYQFRQKSNILIFLVAARMESTGRPHMIQISQATANILSSVGKHHWIVRRQDAVEAKGKGALKTYWLNPSVNKKGSVSGSEQVQSDTGSVQSSGSQALDDAAVKRHRMVDWITHLLLEHIKKVVSKARASLAS